MFGSHFSVHKPFISCYIPSEPVYIARIVSRSMKTLNTITKTGNCTAIFAYLEHIYWHIVMVLTERKDEHGLAVDENRLWEYL